MRKYLKETWLAALSLHAKISEINVDLAQFLHLWMSFAKVGPVKGREIQGLTMETR